MFLADVVNSGTIPALEKMLSFVEQRQRVLVENIANIDTPNYKTRQLDTARFQKSLREAIDRRKETGSSSLELKGTRQFRQDAMGRLRVTPEEVPPENILFHDGTNQRVEKQMAQLAENGMMHQTITQLLLDRFKGLNKAISGRIT